MKQYPLCVCSREGYTVIGNVALVSCTQIIRHITVSWSFSDVNTNCKEHYSGLSLRISPCLVPRKSTIYVEAAIMLREKTTWIYIAHRKTQQPKPRRLPSRDKLQVLHQVLGNEDARKLIRPFPYITFLVCALRSRFGGKLEQVKAS